jgi:hypothetical protein
MKSIISLTLILLFVGLFCVDTARSENHRIEILRTASLNGVQLKPGVYRLSLNGANEAEIYKGRNLLVTSEVELVPLANASPNSVVQTNTGQLKEIRLSKERILFVDSSKEVQARR